MTVEYVIVTPSAAYWAVRNSTQSVDSSPLRQRQRSLKVESVISSFPGPPTEDLQGAGNGALCYQVPPWFTNAVHEHSTLVASPFIKMMFEKIQLVQRNERQKAFRRDLKKMAATVKHWETAVALAGKEVDAAKDRLAVFLEKLNAKETLWRRITAADGLICAHQRGIIEALARKEQAWIMLVRAKNSLIALQKLQHENWIEVAHWQQELEQRKPGTGSPSQSGA